MNVSSADLTAVDEEQKSYELRKLIRLINDFPTDDELEALIKNDGESVAQWEKEASTLQEQLDTEKSKVAALKEAAKAADRAYTKQLGVVGVLSNKLSAADKHRLASVRDKTRHERELAEYKSKKGSDKFREFMRKQRKIRDRRKELATAGQER